MNAPLRFCKPADDQPTCHLLLGNCSPSVGVPESSIEELLSLYGGATITLTGRSCVFASFATPAAAAAALQGLHGKPCPSVGGRVLSVSYADVRQQKGCAQPQLSAVRTSAESGVPGLVLLPEFVSEQEEAALLALVDSRPWQALAKRRVQHYGYTFHYESRNVDRSSPPANPLPGVVLPVVERLEGLPGMPKIDQLTVNEYTPGVGLAPHIDTHSAFTGPIISLSLGGPAVMVMRRGQEQRAVQLPPRSLLVMGGEARYAWQHYIPHRKSDVVAGEVVPRAPRRVSFTFRQIRGFPCDCAYPQYCDSQEGQLPPTRIAALNSQGSGDAGLTSGGGSSGGESATSSSSRSSSGTSSSHGNSKAGAQWLAHEGVLACGDGPRLDRGAAVTGKACKAGAVCAGREESVKAAMDMMSSDLGPTDGTLLNSSAATATGSDDCKGAEEASHIAGQSAHGSLHSTPSDEVHSCSLNGAESSTSSALELASVDRELQLLEEQFVHSVYNAIAPHFSSTRFAVWPKVRAFIASLPAGALVADVGCGNGKVFGVRHDIFVLGSDRSQGLAGVAARRLQPGPAAERLRADVAVADAMCLPYRPGSCDGVLCIAVLHHISSQLRRLRLLSQLLRLLVPGGRALVTVWATEQENMTKVAKWQPITTAVSAPQQPRQQQQRQEQKQLQHQLCIEAAINRAASDAPAAVPSGDYFVPWHLPLHRAEAAGVAAAAAGKAGPSILRDTSRSSLASASGRCGEAEGCPELEAQPQEAAAVASAAGSPREFPAGASSAPLLDSTKGTVVYKRYYHLFERGELDALVAQLPGARLVDSFYDKDNWCVVVEKA